MAVPGLLTWKGLLYLLGIVCVYGFNVDVQMPFIKQGPQNSYFGFSIAQHKINTSGQHLLLVGAPKYVSGGTYAPGGVYKCEINDSPNCIIINDIESVFVENDPEMTNDQWMGGTVRSSGSGIALACAYRYKENYNPLGRCASLSNKLEPDREIRQCEDDGLENEGTSYCQSGAAASVMSDEEIVLGAPGSVDWTGQLSRIYITGSIFDTSRDKAWSRSYVYHVTDRPPATDKHSYMGYSVVSGQFRGYTGRVYIGGAPRSNSTGQVVIYRKSNSNLVYYKQSIISGTMAFSAFGSDLAAVDFDNDGFDDLIVGCPLYTKTDVSTNMFAGGAIYVYNSKAQLNAASKPLLITLDMSESDCEKMNCLEARFGQSLSGARDLNLDGFPDLAVGAPYDNSGLGAVYIYHGSANGIIPKYVQKITAAEFDPDMRAFGYSLSGGLDLDQNGYPDVSVGSYESNKVILLRTRPIVHLTPNITFSPRKFNLSRPAGCPYDNPALVTKPRYCLELKICLTFTAKPVQSFSTTQKIQVEVVAEKDSVEKRIWFKDAPQPTKASYIQELQFQNLEGCKKQVIYLDDDIKDKLTPIQIDIGYSLPAVPFRRRRQVMSDINKFPILMIVNQTAETSVTSFKEKIDFVKKCGIDDICQSNIQLQMSLVPLERKGNKYVLSIGENDLFKVNIILTNKGEPAYEPSFYLVVPKDMQYAGSIPIYPPGLSPPACININKTTIFCEHTNPFGNSVKSDVRTEFSIELDATNLPLNLTDFTIRGLLNTTSVEQSPGNDEVTLPVRMVTKTNVRVFGEAEPANDIVFRGPIRGSSVVKSEDAIGPAINHTFTVYNEGVGALGAANLEIFWPIEKNPGVYEDGKYLLYLMQVESMDKSKAQCIHDPQYYNILRVTVKTSVVVSNGEGPTYNTPKTRRRREVDQTQSSTTPKPDRESRSGRNIIKLSCKDKSAKCIKINCKIFRLDKGESAKIVVRSRLWESTLFQDYPSSEVQISSLAKVIVSPDLNIFQDPSDDEGTATTYAVPEVKPSVKQELQWWIIVVAIAGGIVLLIVLILIFWKCGFFKRVKPKDYEPTFQGEIKKSKDYDNVDYT
ncbi:integrin alpha-6-like isoform X2 [Ostrea edulis]|uniref:integrin alpha-6-like isoform X2 n=1 Tax=Ostrea edulis TaxID=37623 RepID=UPI0024AEA90B|nr:integrin alpha-6-like isoform X2 [Ostrea edulis]